MNLTEVQLLKRRAEEYPNNVLRDIDAHTLVELCDEILDRDRKQVFAEALVEQLREDNKRLQAVVQSQNEALAAQEKQIQTYEHTQSALNENISTKNKRIEDLVSLVQTLEQLLINRVQPNEITFDMYQILTQKYAVYPGKGSRIGMVYCALGLAEAGEVQEKIKKIWRDFDGLPNAEQVKEIGLEEGDVLWYLAALASELKISFGSVAKNNIDKLESRYQRGVIQGQGDNR